MKIYVFLALLHCLSLHYIDACNLVILATETETNVTSPNYPLQYKSDTHCWWLIKASSEDKLIGVKFDDFSLEMSSKCVYDKLSFYDGTNSSSPLLATMCGNKSWSLLSTGNTMFINFTSDIYGNRRGFVLKVFEVQKCGGEITATSNSSVLTSPGYPYTYFNNMNCTWTITAENESDIVTVTVPDINLQNSVFSMCMYDSLTFYNGNSTGNDLIGQYCDSITLVLQSSQSTMTVQFTTDNTTTRTGFRFFFTSKPAQDCNSTLLVDLMPTYIYSPGYPDRYYNDLDCIIRIVSIRSTIRLDVLFLDIEGLYPQCNDSLAVYSGEHYNVKPYREGDCGNEEYLLGTLCGHTGDGQRSIRVFETGYDSLELRFKTNSDSNGTGFKLRARGYTPPRITTRLPPRTTPAPCGSRYLTAYGFSKYLTSPGYPSRYYNNEDCVWTITASDANKMVRITILDASLEGSHGLFNRCPYDYVEIYNGSSTRGAPRTKWCDKSQTIFQSTGQCMTLRFVTDESTSFYRGFKVRYIETSDYVCSPSEKDPTVCGGRVNVSSLTHLTSPNYPGHYASYLHCIWTVHAPSGLNIKVSVQNMDLEPSCSYDYLVMYDGTGSPPYTGKLCYANDLNYISSSNTMTITFNTDGSSSGMGFDLLLQAGHYHACSQGKTTLQATYSDQFILSPNYPFIYPPNTECTWMIDTYDSDYTVHLDVQSSSIEFSAGCVADYVEAFDGDDDTADSLGRWCDSDVPTKDSTGQYMFVRFKSDATTARKGFKIAYSKEYNIHWDSSSNTGAVVGGIIGGIAILVIIIIIAGGLSSQRQRPTVTRVPDTATYTVSQGRLETTVTPVAFSAPPPSYSQVTGTTAGGSPANCGLPPYPGK